MLFIKEKYLIFYLKRYRSWDFFLIENMTRYTVSENEEGETSIIYKGKQTTLKTFFQKLQNLVDEKNSDNEKSEKRFLW